RGGSIRTRLSPQIFHCHSGAFLENDASFAKRRHPDAADHFRALSQLQKHYGKRHTPNAAIHRKLYSTADARGAVGHEGLRLDRPEGMEYSRSFNPECAGRNGRGFCPIEPSRDELKHAVPRHAAAGGTQEASLHAPRSTRLDSIPDELLQ